MTDSLSDVLIEMPRRLARRRELFAWAMFDFANSGYTTVVLTTIYSVYFVNVIAPSAATSGNGTATLLWSVAMALTNLMVIVTAPVIGAIADRRALKKRLLAFSTVGCVLFTALLGFVEPGAAVWGMVVVILATFMFSTGENLIAAFLNEIAPPADMGRISGYGWALGYVGGLLVLALCLTYIASAEARGLDATHFVPVTLWLTAAVFALAALPTFLWLPERAQPHPLDGSYIRDGFARVAQTLRHVRQFRDLFRFLVTLTVYFAGIQTVVVLAAVYAQQVMAFSQRDIIVMILVVNITAAVGAFAFGHLQDQLGSVRTLALTLLVWIVALVTAYVIETRFGFWIVANLVGLALGSSQSAGRALVGQFAPPARAAEFFGLWGLAGKLAAIVGPLTYGLVAYVTAGDHRLALLATSIFFGVGLALLLTVNEQRGRATAQSYRE